MQQPRLHIEATQNQHTPGGDFLGKLYYSTRFLDKTLEREEHSGYPHNGGQHSLYLYMTPSDLSAWLELVEETYPNQHGCVEFVTSVREKFAKRYPKYPLM
jgi:hypothetical protein